MIVCPEEPWDYYPCFNDTDGQVVVGFCVGADEIDQELLPYCARIIITIKAPNVNGGPSDEEAEILWKMEDDVVAALQKQKVNCRLLGRLTYSGLRELIFQLEKYESFRPPVGNWIFKNEDYEIDVSEHDGWDFFFANVWPSDASWVLINSRRVIDDLIESGSDPDKAHSLEFFFSGGLQGLSELEGILRSRGYQLMELSVAEGTLSMSLETPLELEIILREQIKSQEDCDRLGLEYEGWGALSVS